MKDELALLLSLRRTLEATAQGMGIARALAEGLRSASPAGVGVARLVLLGYPLRVSMAPLADGGSDEVAMLASLIVSATKSSALTVGRSGEVLEMILERWVKAKEGRRLEQRILRFRGLVTSGVAGAVVAMLASLGPMVGNLSLATGASSPAAGLLLPGAAVMAGVSSAMLGLFMSGRGFVANVAVSMGVFAVVSAIAYPLANVPTLGLWGVK